MNSRRGFIAGVISLLFSSRKTFACEANPSPVLTAAQRTMVHELRSKLPTCDIADEIVVFLWSNSPMRNEVRVTTTAGLMGEQVKIERTISDHVLLEAFPNSQIIIHTHTHREIGASPSLGVYDSTTSRAIRLDSEDCKSRREEARKRMGGGEVFWFVDTTYEGRVRLMRSIRYGSQRAFGQSERTPQGAAEKFLRQAKEWVNYHDRRKQDTLRQIDDVNHLLVSQLQISSSVG